MISTQQEQQEILINSYIKQSKQTKNILSQNFLQTSFNKTFDQRLSQLILKYSFEFDRIALHLYYQFPQYSQRVNSRTVGFRWWQLQRQRQINLGKQQSSNKNEINQMESSSIYQKAKENISEIKESSKFERKIFHQTNEWNFGANAAPMPLEVTNNQMKKQMYDQAISISQSLTEQEQESFILYKPKFILNSGFKLQKQEFSDDQKADDGVFLKSLEKMLTNQSDYEFGSFDDAVQIASAIEPHHIDQKDQQQNNNNNNNIQQETYLDNDWQEYQSD